MNAHSKNKNSQIDFVNEYKTFSICNVQTIVNALSSISCVICVYFLLFSDIN